MSARTRRLLTSTWAALFVFSLLMQTGALATPASSKAYVGDSATSPFELDGNAVASTGHDWNQVYADRNGPPYSNSGASHVIFATDVTGAGDDILTGGSTKDTIDLSSWLWDQTSSTSVQDKDDIENAFAAAYTAQNGHRIAYFGLDRYSISGDATAGFWFFKNGIAKSNTPSQGAFTFSGTHAEGDLLVVMDFSNGGANGSATVYEWHNGALVNTNVAGGECDGTNQTVCAITNIVDATSPWPYTPKSGTANVFPAAPIKGSSQGAGAFYEGGLDMTALGLDQSCYSTFMAETRSSNIPSSTLSDFVLGQFSFCNPPDIQTTASPSSLTIGSGTVTDTATLSGSAGPVTGSVSFFVCGPNATNPDCKTVGTGTQVGTAVAISNGSATSAAFTPPGVGSYCFRAEYTPDASSQAKYLPTSHSNQDSECFTVTKAKPTISTSAAETVNVGAVIHDSAVLSGGYSPTGTITFNLYGPADTTCSAAPVYTTTATVNGNDTYGPVSYTTTQAGTFRWIASYGGDTKNAAASGKCNDTGENDLANKLQPAISTSATASVTIGSSISDSATLSGGYNPTGSITFKLYGPFASNAIPSCTAGNLVFTSNAVAVSGNATYGPVSFTPTTAGTYYWIASYGGDGNNLPISGACGDTGETSVVNPAAPSISTILVSGNTSGATISVPLGSTVHDTSSLTGASATAGGTVHYTVYSDNTCSTAAFLQDAGTANVVDGVPGPSIGVTFNVAGTYYWQADYSGDVNNLPATSACNLEQVGVTKNTPTITTQASPTTSIVVGTPTLVGDTATLVGAWRPTGSVAFTLYSDSSCVNAVAGVSGMGTISGTTASYSTTWTPTSPGTYYWKASYAGDINNTAFTTGCTDANEQLTVIKATTDFSTQASPTASIVVGTPTAVSDTATMSGGYNPGGTVSFALYSDNTCTTAVAGVSGTGTISNGAATYSTSWTPTAPGTYYWNVSYGGDANNNAVPAKCGGANETLTVIKSPTSISTVATVGGKQGDQISDTATVTGYHPTGNVTFKLYGPADQTCSGTAVFTSTNALDGNGQATSDPYTVLAAPGPGTYHWIASYAGDANNDAVSGKCGDPNETTTISQFAPKITTSLASDGVTSAPKITVLFGSSVTDQATLSNFGPTAGGSVEYTVYSDAACTNLFASGGSKTVVNGVVPASNAVAFPTAGTYYWLAMYSGDSNNAPATSTCGDEVVTVTTPDLSAVKLVSVNGGTPTHTSTAKPGDTLTYSITVTNSGNGDATNVPVADDISAILAHASFVSCTGSCSGPTAGVLSWTIPTITADGGTATVGFVVKLSASFPNGTTTLPNTAVVTGPGSNCVAGSNDPLCSTTTTVNQPGLGIAKSFTGNSLPPLLGNAQAAAGDTLTYTLAYTITTPPAHNGVITDVLPAGQTYVAGSATGNAEFTFQGYDSTSRTLTWTAPVVTANGSVTYKVTIDANAASLTQPLINTATIRSAETAPASATAQVFVPAPPLAITQPPTDTLPTPQPGNPGFSLMLLLLGLAGFALALGYVTPVPERARRRDRD